KPALFLVHGAGGDVLWGYANLATHLGAHQPLYGIRSRGQVGLDEFNNLEEMAAFYVEQVRQFQPKGPYLLGGYCFGGNVAYEMARQFRKAGDDVALVLLLDSAPSNAGHEKMRWWRPGFGISFAKNLAYWLNDFRRLQPVERRRFISRKAKVLGRKIRSKFGSNNHREPVDLEEVIDTSRFPDADLTLWQTHLNALVQH